MFGFFTKTKWPVMEFEDIKKRSRLLVIDDQEFPYKVLFEKHEYQIDKWDDVLNLTKLENGYYDIILLDLQGVAKDFSNEEGIGLLKHIKKVNRSQIVLAYSNAEWSLRHQDFFKLADAALAKTQDYYVFQETVDQFLKKRFSIDYYIGIIDNLISDLHGYNKSTTLNKIKKCIIRKNSQGVANELKGIEMDTTTLNTIITVINTAIGIFEICSK